MFKILTTLLCSALLCHAADNMKAFPPAEKGMTRHVLNLPEKDAEDLFKVELIVGKTVKTDGVNRHFFAGSVEEVNIEGWGYSRYLVQKLGPMAGTLMAGPPGAPKVDTFVSLGGEPYLVRYNSKLPIVIYTPEDCEVRYKIWRTDAEVKPMPKG